MAIYDIDGNALSAGTSKLEEDALRLGVHLMPKSVGELNMVRRARQFTDIKWTPAANIKRKNAVEYDAAVNWSQSWQDVFTAGVEYKGIPYSHGYYSGAYRNYCMVGYQVSLDAFATAVQFANSYFCSTDPWNADDGVYAPYGITCDTLGCYAMGLDTWYGAVSGYQTLVDNGTIVAQFNSGDIESNISNVHLGDILWGVGVHVAVITDVVIEDNGEIFIEVSEATTRGASSPDENGLQKGGVTRRELWPLAEFLKRFPNYTVYRYADAENVSYTQSKFVALDGEAPMHNVQAKIPLIPYMGDDFAYLSGHIPNTNILIGTSEYAYLAVYKDGTLFNTFTINSASSVAVGFSATGEYEAFLYNSTDGTIANLTNRTVACKWSVVAQ